MTKKIKIACKPEDFILRQGADCTCGAPDSQRVTYCDGWEGEEPSAEWTICTCGRVESWDCENGWFITIP
jgi:hypothetical protein